jgi:hypothetical protein
MEHRWLKPPNSRYDAADVVAERFQTLEIRNKGDRVALTLPPITPGDIEMWTAIDGGYGSSFLDKSQPLVGFDHKLLMLGDSHSGIGVPESLLTPTASLIDILDVQSNTPFSYQDQDGIGLALVIWRAEYDTSDYYLTWPRTYGSGIVIRPDLLARLIDAVGEERLVLRDYVVGALELIAPEKA